MSALLHLSGACGLSTRFLAPFFGDSVTSVAMQEGKVQVSFIIQETNRCLKQVLVGAILTPPQVPFIDLAPMHPLPLNGKLTPLDSCVQDVQDVVKDFIPVEYGLGSSTSS